jgi:O-antigen/teichoic acid export membrane protein
VGAIAVVPAAITIFLVMVLFGSIFAVTLPIFIPPIIGLGFLAYIALCLGVFLIVAYLAPILISFLGGQRLMQWLKPSETRQILTLGIGLLIFVILTALPVVGSILSLLVALIGLGALWLLLRPWRWGDRLANDQSLASI